jgi:nucleotide-binding universal stress UspA family protein
VVVASNSLKPETVGHLTPEMQFWIAEDVAETQAWTQKIVKAAMVKLRAADLTASFAIKEDDPKRALLDEAEKWKADCIFVGATGLGGLDRFLLGSVSSAVAARAHCSVEVVRTGERA